ncbi:MAG: ABC transporter ATP-binding protein [Clostridia bacterium]|nr:ABC transporter ATP-binding protein [Clostridia bacterium]
MITVSHLTKRYGAHTAVSDVSFTIEKGKVYGFLGPNGAGKSTTMNIITGCLAATEGEVTIDGHDIFEEPLEAKKRIGYLPEIPPLYTDMTPTEYLRFIARARGFSGAEARKQMNAAMERARITEVKDRLIRNLSKGYRQRVGIAQALIGNPEVIILDEPTVGLDPRQIIEIRELIRELGKNHTVILSSHILSEVSAICDEILILSGGRLVADDTPENLTALFAEQNGIRLTVKGALADVLSALNKLEGAEIADSREEDGQARLTLRAQDADDVCERVFRALAQADLPILEMARERATLEDVFLELIDSDKGEEAVSAEAEEPKEEEAASDGGKEEAEQ